MDIPSVLNNRCPPLFNQSLKTLINNIMVCHCHSDFLLYSCPIRFFSSCGLYQCASDNNCLKFIDTYYMTPKEDNEMKWELRGAKYHYNSKFKPWPGCSKLTMLLVSVLLKFQTLISNIRQYFLWKKCEKLLHCKSSYFFQQKISVVSNKVLKYLRS